MRQSPAKHSRARRKRSITRLRLKGALDFSGITQRSLIDLLRHHATPPNQRHQISEIMVMDGYPFACMTCKTSVPSTQDRCTTCLASIPQPRECRRGGFLWVGILSNLKGLREGTEGDPHVQVELC